MMKIKNDETEIVGKWQFDGKKMTKDENCIRIEWLRDNYLMKLKVGHAGWSVLYQDPEDQWSWELTYEESIMHGGGPPTLRNLSADAAKSKYGV